MERELRTYRANPTDVGFGRLYSVAYPWLKNTGMTAIGKYRSLSMSGTLDDVVNAGALALSVSARRFSFYCGECEAVFVDAGDLVRHAKFSHRRRGAVGLVSLSQFARTSARLAMKRTARRLHRPEILTDEIDRYEAATDLDVEDRLILEIMIGRLRERLSERSRAHLELVLRSMILDSSEFDDLRREAECLIGVKTRKEIRMPDYSPEPKWSELNVRTLKGSAKEVLGFETDKRTMKTVYADLHGRLKETERELVFTCQNCHSLIDDDMERCWACGLIFTEGSEEPVVDDELVERAKKLGIDVDGKDRAGLLSAIEDLETRTREARKNVDLLTLESKRLNDQITEAMPDGWSKKVSRQYTAYFDVDRVRRIAIFNRGMKVCFSVEDEMLDGFADLVFFDREARRAKHYGRTNYEYGGDIAQYALDLCKRVMKKYGG